jgi:hypothetical protein
MCATNGKVRVLIATTKGPVEVLLLTKEDPIVGRSAACIGGTTETADIDAGYNAFVARRTGVIERLFGHSSYRIDFSERVDAGSSWQLGVLIAHALDACGRLANEGEQAATIICATGTVRAVDLTIGAVLYVPEKLTLAGPRLHEEATAGRQVIVALPAANAGDVAEDIKADFAAHRVQLVAEAQVRALLDHLGIAKLAEPTEVLTAGPQRHAKSPMWRGWPAVSLAAACIAITSSCIAYLWRARSTPEIHTASDDAHSARDRLKRQLEQLLPGQHADEAVSLYFSSKYSRAMLVSARTRQRWIISDGPSPQPTLERGLERCQLAYNEPCAAVAIDDRVVELSQDWAHGATDPPRMHYNGPFNMEEIPVISRSTRARTDVLTYSTASSPKASAIHATGTFTIVTNAASQRLAEESALELCNKERRARAFLPCYLYSVDDRVVLWLRSTGALTK